MNAVLRLDATGTPTHWISYENAAMLYAKNLVLWSLGESIRVLRGGINNIGIQSTMDIESIVAIRGDIRGLKESRKSFTNRQLFRRDHSRCMYCGNVFCYAELTRDHVIPKAQNGKDLWENVVAACKACNHYKADRTPEQAGMELLAIPFKPNVFEWAYLSQHTVLDDQMSYLEKRFSGNRNWRSVA